MSFNFLKQVPKSFFPLWIKYRKSSVYKAASYSLLSAWPPIIHAMHWIDEELVCSSLNPLFEHLRTKRAYFLFSWSWMMEDLERIRIRRQMELDHLRQYPGHQFIHLCNTSRQQELFQGEGLNAVFCNQNCLIDENIFKPLPNVCKKYDAIYDARLQSYKRYNLAIMIQNLALIYFFNPRIDNPEYMERTKREFAHAHFFNHANSSDYIRLNPTEVNRCLNACKVGLCLSAMEGAMYASTQYLLSGMPVVSTKSQGGRDVFFDDEYVLIVDDNPTAVRDGVKELIQCNIPAHRIRSKTIEKIQTHLRILIALVQSLYDREGVQRNFSAEWNGLFFHKLIKWQKHSETIAHINQAWKQQLR